jgi:hypothetical protein
MGILKEQGNFKTKFRGKFICNYYNKNQDERMDKIFIILLLLFSLTISIDTIAQQKREGKIGIGYSGNFTTQTNELSLSFWVTDVFVIEPQFGFRHIELENTSGTTWKPGFGLLVRFNQEIVSPYAGTRAKFNILSGGDKTYTDIVVSLVFGGDYFFADWFSIGAEMKLNYIDTDEDFTPTYTAANASIFETEQVINLRIYL